MKYYIITGEPSGDMHAANLVAEIKLIDSECKIRAWGGEKLSAEGVSIAKNIKETAYMGFWSVFKNLKQIRSNLSFCKQDILLFNPDALILVDYPGFNLKIAEFAKKKGLKVFYYISPKVWAWNKSRISKIKSFVDHMLVVFPFETSFYDEYQIDVNYVGNPLFDEINKKNHLFSFKSSRPIIALLPGSRKQEIAYILPIMLKIVNDYPNYQFVIAGSNMFEPSYYNRLIRGYDVAIVYDETYGLLANAEVAFVTSGTATLEAALFDVPQVVCYKTSWLTYIIAKSLIKLKYISLVNILLEKIAVKELIQKDLNNENLKLELDLLFENKSQILNDYKSLRNLFKKEGASKNAAKVIFSSI